MRTRDGRDRRAWHIPAAAALSCSALVTCVPAAPQPATSACPRDARLQGGLCTCLRDRVLLLGACVDPSVRDGYCGPAAQHGTDACVFRTCAGGEALDEGGRCIPVGTVARAGSRCDAPSMLVVTGGGRAACVPADIACPRGTLATDAACRAPPSCPAGALWTGRACRSVVSRGPRGSVVDLGSWAAIALGPSGGPGSPELCRPLASAPLEFGLSRGDRVDVRLVISVTVPDQDMSRVFASVRAQVGEGHPLAPAAEQRVAQAVGTMIEPLRGLGGESSTAAVQVEVRCPLASL